jgi:2-polyprenyl-6-methoxyphenol hydroxylase-like FAD-dependent oxidoreductase
LVIGAGPGGLSAALALKRVGIHAEVFERAPQLQESGAGLGLQANAIKALQRLGAAEPLLQVSPPVEWREVFSAKGKLLLRIPVGEIGRELGVPQIIAHRQDLQQALLKQLDRNLIHVGTLCTGFEQDADGVTALFADGRKERGAFLIGSDGMRSAVRQQLLGDTKLRYAGNIAWRGVVVPGRDLWPLDCLRQVMGPHGRVFSMFHLGLGRVYWFAHRLVPEGAGDAPGGRKNEILDHYKGFPDPVETLIEATPESAILRHEIYDRDPDSRWSDGRVVLLGDAAHLTTPNMGQGAGLAVEDAVVLGKELSLSQGLADRGAIQLALRAYERQRMPRTATIVLQSRQIGEMAHWHNPVKCWIRDMVMTWTPTKVWKRRLAATQAYDA